MCNPKISKFLTTNCQTQDLGKFFELLNEELFNKVRINFDTIEWPNGIDLDPEFLYKHSENNIITSKNLN